MAIYTTKPSKGGERPGLYFLTSLALMTCAPVALATYAKSRPATEATCWTSRDTLFAELRLVDVTTCRVAGVEVSRIVVDAVTGEEVR